MTATPAMTAEQLRLQQSHLRAANWQRWGPYLSERQWGTVREDYSATGECWDYFPHDHARSRAYRWGEDGLMGICDRECRLCFALALWNGNDPILKERLFGLGGTEGNHAEDVKEVYFYLDSSPTHSYLKALYKYPQAAFPYDLLVSENRRRGRLDPEFEITDTNVFDNGRYFDVFVEYAKANTDDILIRITAANHGPNAGELHLLPTLWFRNSWSWGCGHEGCEIKPRIDLDPDGGLRTSHASLGAFRFFAEAPADDEKPTMLFTENETNFVRVFGFPEDPAVKFKDAFHEYVIEGNKDALSKRPSGSKAAAYYQFQIPAGQQITLRLRLFAESQSPATPFGPEFDQVFAQRIADTDEFYEAILSKDLTPQARSISRQAAAGLLWSKQFYFYSVKDWLHGDPDQPAPPAGHQRVRNVDWQHVFNRDVISMPDKWEYPWYAAWDLAFHMLPFAKLDPEYAKNQLILFLREWYMHPNGQIPAYEFAFSDVNPPVHAWACWRVYKMTAPRGQRDRLFLARTFQKLLLNFTWWVNRKDIEGNNLFSGGFLGLDNIGVFDRSRPLPGGGVLEQADGTAWMAFYCVTMLAIALELAAESPEYEDIASKFFEHFVAIVDAMNSLGGSGLWDETDGFYYDQLHVQGNNTPLKIRSIVGLIPLFAVEVLDDRQIDRLPGFKKRMQWFLDHRKDLAAYISYCQLDSEARAGDGVPDGRRLLAIPSRERLARVLRYLLDEQEFLSDYGIRSVSRIHKDHPFVFNSDGHEYRVDYEPGESTTGLFGGNSNWRGPIWMPINFLFIEALERYHHFYGDSFLVECPTGSGRKLTLKDVAREVEARVAQIFLADSKGRRPCHGTIRQFIEDAHWRDYVLFYEYFHGDIGRGCGASHQTGWTALITRMLWDLPRPSQPASTLPKPVRAAKKTT
ncbi:MAG TPA: glucosidase [Planctomycetaceae bacterium]|nr:glucosidase [Planctomycetaceae bacterium]